MCVIRYYRMAVISFKVSAEDARAIRAQARKQRLTVSEFLRRQALAPVRPEPEIKLRKCPLTGAMVFDRVDDVAALSVESTREILADFP